MFDQLPLSRHVNASHSSGINEFHFSHFVDVPSPNLQKGRVQTLKAKHSQRHSPTHFLIIFCFGCGLACDCKNARTEKRHLQHLRKQLLDTHLARRFNSVGTLCPSCLWGTRTKLNHLENIPSVWMFCFGCPLASRAPLVRIQDIATAKNLTMRGLQNKQGF